MRVAGTVFGLMALGHVLRLVTKAEVLIGGWALPPWASLLGALIGGGLSVWRWRWSGCCGGSGNDGPAG
jgi:hypothetical protein